MDVLRKISAGDRYLRSGLWSTKGDYPLGWKLGGKRVGIVGLGNIGSEVAKRLVAFGCAIAYNSRKKRSSVSFPYYADHWGRKESSSTLAVDLSLIRRNWCSFWWKVRLEVRGLMCLRMNPLCLENYLSWIMLCLPPSQLLGNKNNKLIPLSSVSFLVSFF
ncbi:unnamed protein product, partial [Vitis vinifera]